VRTRFIVIGGFLGAGKTTAILRLAQRYAARGLRVGVVANDLSEGLVDTATYQAHGLAVEELAGGCFSCKFDELLAAAGRLRDGGYPDVLIAEPAGSCVDLLRKVIEPLRLIYDDRFEVAPYAVLLDPQRARAALSGRGPGGFSAKVTFLYRMQQNEAQVVALNKCDTLAGDEADEIERLVRASFPAADVLRVSARCGDGFDALEARLQARAPAVHPRGDAAPADPQTQALQGDAQLAWLNATFHLSAPAAFDPDRLALALLAALRRVLASAGCEPAHVKCVVRADGQATVASLVASDRAPELTLAADQPLRRAELLLNARVEGQAEPLRAAGLACVAQVARESGVEARLERIESLHADPTNAYCTLSGRASPQHAHPGGTAALETAHDETRRAARKDTPHGARGAAR